MALSKRDVEEIGKFAEALVNCAKDGSSDDLRGGLSIAAGFVTLTVDILKQISKSPFSFFLKVLLGGEWDPYEALRDQARDFIRVWS